MPQTKPEIALIKNRDVLLFIKICNAMKIEESKRPNKINGSFENLSERKPKRRELINNKPLKEVITNPRKKGEIFSSEAKSGIKTEEDINAEYVKN